MVDSSTKDVLTKRIPEVFPLPQTLEVDFTKFYDSFKEYLTFSTPEVNITNKKIKHATLLRPQFALAGYTEHFLENAITILGNTEINFLNTLSFEKKIEAIHRLSQFEIPCILLTGGATLPQDLILVFSKKGIPIFSTNTPTPILIYQILDWLDDYFAPRATVYGNLVEIYNVGVLIIGESGIGKSEISLDLIRNGHKLISDDLVIVSRKWGNKIIGKPVESYDYNIEIRGSGIIEVTRLFGVKAILPEKEIKLIINLVRENSLTIEEKEKSRIYESIGLNHRGVEILGVTLELVDLFVKVGRYLTPLIESIALYHHSKQFEYEPNLRVDSKSLLETYQKPRTHK
ncbi:MAG: HPr(Ser) kinase/phosphatase [Candidatus Kapaibacteriales bacterium]